VAANGDTDLHPDFDPERWVTAAGYDDRLLLGFNPHVHAGRIGVWAAELGTGTRISASDVMDASPIARAWIDGFLAGNEPAPGEMFGEQVYDLPDDHPKWIRWRAAVTRFRATGRWDGGHWYELDPIDPSAQLVEPAWARRGDEIWLWDGNAWNEADPQPEWSSTGPPDTRCEVRQAHNIGVVSARHLQCEDCGKVTQYTDD
jgi:hypothetical protein